jgi:hypothetical protein
MPDMPRTDANYVRSDAIKLVDAATKFTNDRSEPSADAFHKQWLNIVSNLKLSNDRKKTLGSKTTNKMNLNT